MVSHASSQREFEQGNFYLANHWSENVSVSSAASSFRDTYRLGYLLLLLYSTLLLHHSKRQIIDRFYSIHRTGMHDHSAYKTLKKERFALTGYMRILYEQLKTSIYLSLPQLTCLLAVKEFESNARNTWKTRTLNFEVLCF